MPPTIAEPAWKSPRKFALRIIVGLVAAFYGLFLVLNASDAGQNEQLFTILGWALLVFGFITAAREWKAVSNPRLAWRYSFNPVRTVQELIEEWKPGNLALEKNYEKSLLEFLRSKLRHVKITRQYGAARIKCDVAVGKDALIELKTNLTTTAKLQRLLGQVQLYKKELDTPIIILLLGRTDDDLFKTLYSNSSNSVRLVQKP